MTLNDLRDKFAELLHGMISACKAVCSKSSLISRLLFCFLDNIMATYIA